MLAITTMRFVSLKPQTTIFLAYEHHKMLACVGLGPGPGKPLMFVDSDTIECNITYTSNY